MIPGEVVPGAGELELFGDKPTIAVEVVNTGDRPVQVGSHYHFAEVNHALSFDRAAARGFRLAVPAGTSVRFEPGIEQTVALVALGGHRIVAGLRGEVAGRLDGPQ
jgi:urease subunit beta